VSDLREGAIEALYLDYFGEDADPMDEIDGREWAGVLDALLDYLTEQYWDHNGPTYGLLAVLAAAEETP